VGVGKTLNYGRPAAWIITLLFIGCAVGVLLLVNRFHG
jgi:uncharacterized membrane protein